MSFRAAASSSACLALPASASLIRSASGSENSSAPRFSMYSTVFLELSSSASSNKACKKWVDLVKEYQIEKIAPQHGYILENQNVDKFLDWFYELECGIDII
jgi:hypothetical protein